MVPDLLRFGPYPWLCLLCGIAWSFRRLYAKRSTAKYANRSTLPKSKETYTEDVYDQIEPLSDLDVHSTQPLQIRPFKPKFHMTMALENVTVSDLVAVDKTYLGRTQIRRQLIQDRPNDVLAANPVIVPAVQEYWTWMSRLYLPQRFPTMFQVDPSGTQVRNLVTSEDLPIKAATAEEALRLLGSHVDTDFLFLLPSSDPADEGKYKLEGFITCFPSGFDTSKKLNLKLADIHAPVPGYGAKLEKSMDRFFASLPVGKIVRRVNWAVTTHTNLFSLGGNHLSEEEKESGEWKAEEIDIDKTVLRTERQTLHRLPESKALVFAFKTYQYPMRQVKEEGNGEALAAAIDGLSTGSVPGMATYKRGVVWGEKVKEFLIS